MIGRVIDMWFVRTTRRLDLKREGKELRADLFGSLSRDDRQLSLFQKAPDS
ncbi:MAG: hypothetical protein OXC54_10390 [Rhodospirillaceae bacterium]|nr:hypothetical protein [Rhodospirillaceae bacterium]